MPLQPKLRESNECGCFESCPLSLTDPATETHTDCREYHKISVLKKRCRRSLLVFVLSYWGVSKLYFFIKFVQQTLTGKKVTFQHVTCHTTVKVYLIFQQSFSAKHGGGIQLSVAECFEQPTGTHVRPPLPPPHYGAGRRLAAYPDAPRSILGQSCI